MVNAHDQSEKILNVSLMNLKEALVLQMYGKIMMCLCKTIEKKITQFQKLSVKGEKMLKFTDQLPKKHKISLIDIKRTA